ncbi:MMPL family transporter [Corynebacterium terpenotabidum]|uniref:RND superfamily drug exporter n=1 Tax=Corynebacterium terpenotabidum Y-11 TaxID=1200352 RepID=S4XHV7_9CORY|nr:MMPL family transporter [Corynebacterium terpenotabidum]AGP31270.1 RND superfamily drug exporter [Corynebacterium terpenotabidum Y-11]
MAKLLYRIGRSAYLHRWRFIAVWLIILIGAGTAAATLMRSTSESMTIPGMQSLETNDKVMEIFGGSDALNAPSGTVVVRAPEGKTLSDSDVKADLDALIADLQSSTALTATDEIVDPVTAAAGMEQQFTEAKTPQLEAQGLSDKEIEAALAADLADLSPLSEDGRTGTFTILFNGESTMDIEADDITAVTDLIDDATTDNLDISYAGNAFQTTEVGGTAEIIGIIVAALILIVTFGSFVAAGLPLISAIVGLGIGIALIYAGTAFTDSINSTTPTLASMIGLAVGIDYALFIVSRFRNELISYVGGNDLEPKELAQKLKGISHQERAHLAGLAVGKAGSAVCFAGLTVLIALTALSIINIPFLTAMALAAALTVAIAVIVAVSFLPAVLGAFGTKVFAARAPWVKAPDPENEKPTMGLSWVRMIRKRPAVFLITGGLILILFAIPVFQMRLAMPTDGTSKLGSPQRTAYEWIDEGFGPGRNAQMVGLVEAAEGTSTDDAAAVYGAAVQDISAIDGVKHAQIIQMTEDSSAAQLLITPENGATDAATSETLQAIRDAEAAFAAETGASYEITGATAIYDDISDRLSSVLIPYVAIVVVLAFLLLMIVFRSLWVPLIAALGFALSVAATFGVTVGIWQEGWFGITNDPQPLLSFLPIMLIGIVFGLAMDYQVFLVTRMREGYVHGKTAGDAVSNGFKHGARVVTAAALIMMSVFAAFILMDEQLIKVMGSALALAVFFDAFIVRMTIVPATLFLLGDRAWTLPAWLDKIIPKVDVEGEGLVGMTAPEAEKSSV